MHIKELLQPSKEKIMLDLAISVLLVISPFCLVSELNAILMSLPLMLRIIDILVNLVIYGVVLYPLACLIVNGIRMRFKKKSRR